MVDESDMRRGKQTANEVFGKCRQCAGRGFYLHTILSDDDGSGFHACAETDVSATNVIAEGEVLQLMNCNDPDISEAGLHAGYLQQNCPPV